MDISLDEPSPSNFSYWLERKTQHLRPIENARWNESHIDSMFYAGAQDFVNRMFNFAPQFSYNKYYFNLIQQPVNLITGYQRQHRKNICFQATSAGDPKTTDQYSKLIIQEARKNGINDAFSKGCELAAVSGMVLAQPYLDFMSEDPLQGELRLKIWEYNSFMVDPFFRQPDMSDCQTVVCQEFISKEEAALRFPEHEADIRVMSPYYNEKTSFYFLPENTSMARDKLLVLSYVWYRGMRTKERLYSKSRQQFFDFATEGDQLNMMLAVIPDLQVVKVQVPTWKVAVGLNNKLMFKGNNPLGFDRSPFVPIYWNYDPQLNNYSLRVRSLVRPMRDPQFLFNYKVITNNDIAAATINAGWKRKENAVANEDNLRKVGQGYDVIVRSGYELSDVEKIIPSAVPQSDLELATQMGDLIFKTSGIQLENWSGQEDKQISTLTAVLKQAANLLVFQKYFDQWDYSLTQIGEILLQIILNNWNSHKITMYLGEEPTEFFYNRIFSQCRTVVQEGLETPTQQNMAAQQLLDINAAYGREVFPPSFVVKKLNIQDKDEALQFLAQQEQTASEMQQHGQMLEDSINQAKLQELYTKAVSNLAMARERASRSDSNVGLLEERLSEISKNQSLSVKAKMESLEKLIELTERFGEMETRVRLSQVEELDRKEDVHEDIERSEALQRSSANDIMAQMMGQQQPLQNNMQQETLQENMPPEG